MSKKTYAKLPNDKIINWVDLLEKYHLDHTEGASAHTEWDSYVLHNKKLPKIKVVYSDNGNKKDKHKNKHKNKNSNKNEDNEVKNNSTRITKRHREFVWNRDIGNFKNGKCFVCNRTITDDVFEVGHVISKHDGGINHVNNLRAICISCNKSMGTMNLEEFKKDFNKIRKLSR